MEKILITGASGLVGTRLTSLLLHRGYNVVHLVRNIPIDTVVPTYKWDIDNSYIEESALVGVDVVIHLAGANIGEEKWTEQRKLEIFNSRVKSAKLLLNKLKRNNHKITTYITASAIGAYGAFAKEKIYREEDAFANDFLGTVCKKWEAVADDFQHWGVRVVKVRTSLVLAHSCSILEKMRSLLKYRFLPVFASGNQYMPWIDIDDLCKFYIMAVENSRINGAYNVASSEQIRNVDFVNTLAKIPNHKVFVMKLPAFFLNMMIGEMSKVLISGSRVSIDRLLETGFKHDNNDFSIKRYLLTY
jgi:uncharacterized protein (TIGR01777 family)